MDRFSRQKICKDIFKLTINVKQLDIIDLYKLIHETKAEWKFSSIQGTFTKIHKILGHNSL